MLVNLSLYLFSFILGLPMFPNSNTETAGTLTVVFENIEKTGGTLRLALYTSDESFMVEEKARVYNFKIVKNSSMDVVLPDLPYGAYAFAVFQDENDNKILDKNLFGIPIEPYAFSKTPVTKWRLPQFREVKFEVRQPTQSLRVKLEKWKL